MTELSLLTPNRIIYSNRRTLSISISTNGEMTIRAPKRISDRDIYKFITEKGKWIIKKRLEFINKTTPELKIIDGEKITILDKVYTMKLANFNRIRINEDELYVCSENPKEMLIKYLKSLAKEYYLKRLDEISNIMNIKFEHLSVSSAKTNWGSCSFKNNINLNYRLILTTKAIIDYVMIHELCHVKEKNHSQNFWNCVKVFCPDYKKIRKELNTYTYLLNEI